MRSRIRPYRSFSLTCGRHENGPGGLPPGPLFFGFWETEAALVGAPLHGSIVGGVLGLGEEINLLGDDLAAIAVGAVLIGPFGVMDAARDHDHRTLGDMLGNALADAAKAGDPVPCGLALTIAFTVFEAAAGGE